MCEEESFVILGTSPQNSLISITTQTGKNEARAVSNVSQLSEKTSLNTSLAKSSTKALERSAENNDSIPTDHTGSTTKNVVLESMQSQISGAQVSANGGVPNSLNISIEDIGRSALMANNTSSNNNNNKVSMNNSAVNDKSLAASFIMGEIPVNVLKSSVFSQFPSLSTEGPFDEIEKLQKVFSENVYMKDALLTMNTRLRTVLERFRTYEEDKRQSDEKYRDEIQELGLKVEELQVALAKQRNENLELRRSVEQKVEHMKVFEETLQKENADLIQNLSEKTSIMNNMRDQIVKLEEQQLASYECIGNHENGTNAKPDYIDRKEHERVVKELERQMSELLAENIQAKDMQKQYTDEINCLKINLTSAEELLAKARGDIDFLKAKDTVQGSRFQQYEQERDKMKEEMELLRQQVQIYSKDFEMERTARTDLAGEKDQLLQDLRSLQKKNQKLIEQQQRQLEAFERIAAEHAGGSAKATRSAAAAAIRQSDADLVPAPATPPSSSSSQPQQQLPQTKATTSAAAAAAQTANGFVCPVCFKTFSNYSVLNSHANDCLDKS